MGDCKKNMQPSVQSNTAKSDDKGIFGKILPRRNKRDIAQGDSAKHYADNIVDADTKLQEIIATKQADLKAEKGKEIENSLKLGNLKAQQMYLDAIIDLMHDYMHIGK
jgi:hypothetical protein